MSKVFFVLLIANAWGTNHATMAVDHFATREECVAEMSAIIRASADWWTPILDSSAQCLEVHQ